MPWPRLAGELSGVVPPSENNINFNNIIKINNNNNNIKIYNIIYNIINKILIILLI